MLLWQGGEIMKIKPLFDRVLLKRVNPKNVSAGGLLLPTNVQERSEICEVVEVGPGGKVGKDDVEMVVSVGQKVLIREFAGTDFKSSVGEEFKLVMQQDIIAIIEE